MTVPQCQHDGHHDRPNQALPALTPLSRPQSLQRGTAQRVTGQHEFRCQPIVRVVFIIVDVATITILLLLLLLLLEFVFLDDIEQSRQNDWCQSVVLHMGTLAVVLGIAAEARRQRLRLGLIAQILQGTHKLFGCRVIVVRVVQASRFQRHLQDRRILTTLIQSHRQRQHVGGTRGQQSWYIPTCCSSCRCCVVTSSILVAATTAVDSSAVGQW